MLWLLSVPAVRATTWIVDQDGGGDAVTVAEGIALLSDGDTLHINAGVYEEYGLQIDAVGVAIEGDGPGNTIVGWDAGAWLEETVLAMYEGSVSDLTLTGLRGGYGLDAYPNEDGAGLSLSNLVVEGFHGGFFCQNQSSVSIDRVSFRDNDYAVWTYGKVAYLTVVNSIFAGNEVPFYTREPSNMPRGLYWTIANNTIVGAEIGIEMHVGSSNLYGCPYVAIVNNVVAASDIGISVQGYTGVCWSGFINNNLISSDVPEPEYYWQSGIVATDTTIGDPDFVDFSDDDDWTNDNLRIGFASAAIDIGTEEFSRYDATALDADGVGRPLDGDLDGTALPDAGAYEANPDADADG